MATSRTSAWLRSSRNTYVADLANLAKKAGTDVVDHLVNNHNKRARHENDDDLILSPDLPGLFDLGVDSSVGDDDSFNHSALNNDTTLADTLFQHNFPYVGGTHSPSFNGSSTSHHPGLNFVKSRSNSTTNDDSNPINDSNHNFFASSVDCGTTLNSLTSASASSSSCVYDFEPGFEIGPLDALTLDPLPLASPLGTPTFGADLAPVPSSVSLSNCTSTKVKGSNTYVKTLKSTAQSNTRFTKKKKTQRSKFAPPVKVKREEEKHHLHQSSITGESKPKQYQKQKLEDETEKEFEAQLAVATGKGDSTAIRQIKNGREKVRRAKMCNKFEELNDVINITNQMMLLSTSGGIVCPQAAIAAAVAAQEASAAVSVKVHAAYTASVEAATAGRKVDGIKKPKFKKAQVLHDAIQVIKEMQAQIESLAQQNAALMSRANANSTKITTE